MEWNGYSANWLQSEIHWAAAFASQILPAYHISSTCLPGPDHFTEDGGFCHWTLRAHYEDTENLKMKIHDYMTFLGHL